MELRYGTFLIALKYWSYLPWFSLICGMQCSRKLPKTILFFFYLE